VSKTATGQETSDTAKKSLQNAVDDTSDDTSHDDVDIKQEDEDVHDNITAPNGIATNDQTWHRTGDLSHVTTKQSHSRQESAIQKIWALRAG
jgi:hypothetical protein